MVTQTGETKTEASTIIEQYRSSIQKAWQQSIENIIEVGNLLNQGWNPVPSATSVSERNGWVGLDVPTGPGRC